MPNRSVFVCLGNSNQPYKNNVIQAGGFQSHLEGLEILLSRIVMQSCVSNGGSIKTLNTKALMSFPDWQKSVVIVTHQY